jgi:hypothetical protein
MACHGEIKKDEVAWEQEMTKQKEADRNESDAPYYSM